MDISRRCDIYITYSMEYCSAIKKEWKNAICSNMDDPRDYYTKWNKSDRERQKWYQLIWNLKIQMNLFTK